MTHLLWYNPVNKEYQYGTRATYKKVLDDSSEPENFVLLEKFIGMTDKTKTKLKTQVDALNNFKNQGQMLYSRR